VLFDSFVIVGYLERQLDELEFAPDTTLSQTQRSAAVEQEHLPLLDEPMSTSINQSPLPLLLPLSSLIPSANCTPTVPFVQSIIQREETVHRQNDNDQEEQTREDNDEDDDEKENQLHALSSIHAPLSPAMPLNSTYIARQSMPLGTTMPSTLFTFASMMVPNTMSSISVNDTSCLKQPTNKSSFLVPIESVNNQLNFVSSIPREDASTTTTTSNQILQCSVATQTNNDDDADTNGYLTHHQCSDVSECPCVQIYTRSEQLFMASMAIFFRNSMCASMPPEQPLLSLTTMNSSTRRSNQRQQINHHDVVQQATSIINESQMATPTDIIMQAKVTSILNTDEK
jgi:hypothetical protein